MEKAFGMKVGSASLTNRGKGSNANICIETSTSVARDAHRKAGCLCDSHPVLHVDDHRNISQIGEPIISRIAIDMVNLPRGPTPMGVKPRKAMRHVLPSINLDFEIPLKGASSAPYAARTALHSVREMAGFGIVIQKLSQTFSGQLGHTNHLRRVP